MQDQATIDSINIAPTHFGEMEHRRNARIIEDLGIEGDRYAAKRGLNRARRQVLLMDRETLEKLGLKPGTVRENITTRGMDIYSLVSGQRVKIGQEVILEITEPCEPCERMDAIRLGLRVELEGRRGMLTRVIQGGAISVGDPICLG